MERRSYCPWSAAERRPEECFPSNPVAGRIPGRRTLVLSLSLSDCVCVIHSSVTAKFSEARTMAAMAALQSSMTSLSLSSNSFLGQRLSPLTIYPVPGKLTSKPCLIVVKLKQWERKECKPNSLPILHKMHVKVGDTVKIISGHEKGKTGEITKIFKHNSTVIVKDINLKTKHMKSREEGEPGQIIKVEGAIHSSNVMLYSKEKNVASRVGHKILENGQRVRYLIKTGEIIDNAENWKKLKEEKKKTEVAVSA